MLPRASNPETRARSAPVRESSVAAPQPEFNVAPRPPSDPAANPDKPNHNRIVMAVLAGMFALCMAMLLYFRFMVPAERNSGSRAILRVDTVKRDGIVEVTWDKKAIGDAEQGRLEIRNGAAQEQLTLDRNTLVSGRFSYGQTKDIARFRLVVQRRDGTVLEGSTMFVAPPVSTAVLPAPKPVEQPIVSYPAAAPPVPKRTVVNIIVRAPPDRGKATSSPPAQALPTQVTRGTAKPAESPTMNPEPLPVPEPIQIAQNPLLVPPALPAPGAPSLPPPSVAPSPHFQLAGRWILQPGGYSRSPAVPEFVAINVTDANGVVQGTLEARYRSSSKAGRVHFSFSGRVVNGGARCSWDSGGRRGEIEFIRVPRSADMVEVVWRSPESKEVFDEMLRRTN